MKEISIKIIVILYRLALVFTLLPVEAVVVERDVWGVTAGHVLLHRPDDSVEPSVPTFLIYMWCQHDQASEPSVKYTWRAW